MVRGDALDGEGDDLLRLALRVAAGLFLDLADAVGGGGLGFLLHLVHQLPARLVGREAGERLQAVLHLGGAALQLLLLLLQALLAPHHGLGALLLRLPLLVQEVELAVERLLALLEAALHPLDVVSAACLFALPLLAGAERLLAPLQHLGLAQRLRLLHGGAPDALRLVLGGGAARAQAAFEYVLPHDEAGGRSHEEGHGDQQDFHCDCIQGGPGPASCHK